jgi:catalase
MAMGPDDVARQAVDAINAISGEHPGHRAAHAKGALCTATFTPAPDARSLSRAAHLRDGPVRAHVRFSNGSGDPAAPDYEPREGRGMATKFYLPDGSTTDIVGITLPAFFVNTVDGFFDFCRARTPDPATGEPDPNAIGAFLEQHPEALTAGAAILAATPPESYLRCAYNSLHAYRFVDDAGTGRYGRYRWEPEAGEASIGNEDAEDRGPDYLQRDLADRLDAGPAAFVLRVQIAEDSDPVADPSIPFPDDRPWVTVGRIEVTGLAHDRERGDDVLVFDPTRVTDGIELSNDPILLFRTHAYAVSVLRRSGIARERV